MKKEEKLNITEEKIINAVCKLMEEYDDHTKVTSREITREAGVQPSMINYCFGSRDNLLFRVFLKKAEEIVILQA